MNSLLNLEKNEVKLRSKNGGKGNKGKLNSSLDLENEEVKLRRCLYIVFGYWEKNLNEKQIVYTHCYAKVFCYFLNYNCLRLKKNRVVSHIGGYGTLEELLEVITWAQLGIHDKPVRRPSSTLDFVPMMLLVRPLLC